MDDDEGAEFFFRLIGGLLLLGLVGAIVMATWPTSGYLGGAVLLTLIVWVAEEGVAERNAEPSFLEALFRNLRWLGLSVSAGFLLLFIAQLVLVTLGAAADTDTVIRWENGASSLRRWITDLMSPWVAFLLYGVSVFVAIVAPAWSPVSGFVAIRKWTARAGVVVVTATSMTFVSHAAMARGEKQWVAKLDIDGSLEKRHALRRELVAAVVLEDAMNQAKVDALKAKVRPVLPGSGLFPWQRAPTVRGDLAVVLQAAQRDLDVTAAVRAEAEGMAKRSQPLTVVTADRKSRRAAPDPVAEEALAASSEGRIQRARDAATALQCSNRTLSEAKTASVESLVVVAQALLPEIRSDLLRLFVSTFVSTAARESLSRSIPPRVRDLDTARTWVREGAEAEVGKAEWLRLSQPGRPDAIIAQARQRARFKRAQIQRAAQRRARSARRGR